MATLKDLARSLDLSIMAVSKALRDAPDISAQTKERVRAEARRQNYVPNRAAQNLRLKHSQLLGVIVPQINHTYYANLVFGIERQAESLGWQVILANSLDQIDREIAEVNRMISSQVHGIIMAPVVRWQNRLASLEILSQANIPVVLLDRYPAGVERFPRVTSVVAANQKGAELATEYLLDLGHKEILYLAGPNGSSSSAGRFCGYQKTLDYAKVGYDDRRVFLAGDDIDSGRAAMTRVLSEEVSFTAVLAFNDSVAMGAIDVLLRQGFKIPGDISVVGFNDGILAANFRVPLTTIRIPQIDMGSASVRLLKDLLDNQTVAARELPVELVTRDSSGPRILTRVLARE